ncbi:hypothetical protein CBG53_06865 [Porphyromonas gingivalis]|uniref:hypothetical protein n=1 Tax=Porphyromonas gingivalis TaxID=837 RepID=UPI000B4C62F0|nr:hypothetical protein [Porphyromonas gingivalis]OWP29537.1 hypothetical protein CBG53_06865 [Porphyromonas gingivalis]
MSTPHPIGKPFNIDLFIQEVDALLIPSNHPNYKQLIADKSFSSLLDSFLREKIEAVLSERQPHTSDDFKSFIEKLQKITKPYFDKDKDVENKDKHIEAEIKSAFDIQRSNTTAPSLENELNRKEEEITQQIEDYRKTKRKLTRAVISRDTKEFEQSKPQGDSLIISKESLDKRCFILDDIVRKLWIHLSLSLLQGEFLADNEYSTKLNRIVKRIKKSYDDELEEIKYLHPILPRIHALCQELSYMCQLVRIQIEGYEIGTHKHRIFHAPVFDLISMPYAGGVYSREMLQTNQFYDLASRLIAMTKIDICGVINPSAVSSLFLLYKQCTQFIGNAGNTGPFQSLFPWGGNVKDIFSLIQAKTSLLLVHSFYKPSIDESVGKLDLEKSISTPYSRVENFEILYEGERYILKGEATPDLSLLCDTGFKEFDNLKSVTPPLKINDKKLSDVGKSDIENYNTYIENGRAIRKKLPNQEKLKKELLEGKKFDSKYYPIDVLLSLMRTLEKEYTKKEDELGLDRTKYAEAMGTLLKCFSENIQHYKEFVAADQKRALYKDSFFIIDNYDLSIFISSYGCKLFDTDALEYEVYPQYNRLYRKWLSKAQAEAKELTKEAADKASGASQQATIAAEAAQKASDEAAEAAQKASDEAAEAAQKASNKAKSFIEKKSNEILLDVRRESMSTISVFVALITFISVGISILKGVNNLPDYMILAGTLYVFIASIIGFLYFKKIETPQPTGETPQSTGETPQSTEKQFATRCKHFLKKIVSAKGILFSSIGFAVIMIVIGFSWKNDQKLNPKDVEIQEPFFKQIISTDQLVDPIIDQTSSSQKVQQYSLYADSTHKAPRTEASIPKKTSKQ